MAFIRDRIIETGICKGMDLGRNYKRGTSGASATTTSSGASPASTIAAWISQSGYDDTRDHCG